MSLQKQSSLDIATDSPQMRVRAMSNENGKGGTTIIVSLPQRDGGAGALATATPTHEQDDSPGGPTRNVGATVPRQETPSTPGVLVPAGSTSYPTREASGLFAYYVSLFKTPFVWMLWDQSVQHICYLHHIFSHVHMILTNIQ